MIVGWRVASNMRTTMVLDAIEMARWSRGIIAAGLALSLRCGLAIHLALRYGKAPANRGRPSIRDSQGTATTTPWPRRSTACQDRTVYGPARSGLEDRRGPRWPPWDGSTGTTPADCTATSATCRRPSSKLRSTMPGGPTKPWSKSIARVSIRSGAVPAGLVPQPSSTTGTGRRRGRPGHRQGVGAVHGQTRGWASRPMSFQLHQVLAVKAGRQGRRRWTAVASVVDGLIEARRYSASGRSGETSDRSLVSFCARRLLTRWAMVSSPSSMTPRHHETAVLRCWLAWAWRGS